VNLASATGIALTVAFAALGAAKIAKASSMRARAAHVGFSAEQYQLIGIAEVLGAVGISAGLLDAPLGYAAGAGLLALLGGALVTHVRQGDGPAEWAAASLFAAGVVAYLVGLGFAR
jgi:hypothetical protein